jgi:LysM repeat protein
VTVDEIAVANQVVQDIFASSKQPPVTITISDYVVQKGDTLASLAERQIYGTFAQLVSLNQDTTNLFATGTPLLLRTHEDSSAEDKPLEQIVFEQRITYAQLADANGPTPFKAGVELEIPALATVAGPGLYAPYITAQGSAGVSSDTLAAIAGKFGMDVGTLAQIDQNLPSLFAAGQIITLPEGPIQKSHTILATDTLQSLFAIFKGIGGILTLTDFANAIKDMSILRAGALVIGELPQLASSQTLAQTAGSLGITAEGLALANCATYGFLSVGSKLSLDRTVTAANGQKTTTTFDVTTGAYDTFNTLVFLFQQAFAAYEQQHPGSTLSSLTTSVEEIATAAATVSGLVAASRPFLAPPASPLITTAVTPAYPKSIFAVTVALELSRNPQLIAPDARKAPNIGHVSSSLVPQTSATSHDPHSLKQFAVEFEAAFPGLKAATGKQVPATSDEAETRQLWAVDFGAQGINVGIPQQPPQFYALKPLSNQLLSRENVTIYSYVSGQGLIK